MGNRQPSPGPVSGQPIEDTLSLL